jgi:hypothetical protein
MRKKLNKTYSDAGITTSSTPDNTFNTLKNENTNDFVLIFYFFSNLLLKFITYKLF